MSASERTYTTRGIVLRARNLGEADKIVTLLTDDRGKIDAVAKGVRRPKSKLAGKLEFASDATLVMHRGRNLDVVTSASLECAYWSALVRPERFATAHLFAELIGAFCEIDFPVPEIATLLRGAIGAIARSNEPGALVPRFELRLLGALGIGPVSDACVRCRAPFDGAPAWADIEAGGLACAACRPHRADAYALEAADVANFRGLGAGARETVPAALTASPAAARAVEAFMSWHLGKRPKARALVDELAVR